MASLSHEEERTAINPEEAAGYLSQCGGGLFISGLQFHPAGAAIARLWRQHNYRTQGIITNTNINCSVALLAKLNDRYRDFEHVI